jgi:hypothetical protein
LGAGIDVVDRLDVGLVQIGRYTVALERGHVAQEPRYRRAIGGERSRYRDVADFVEGADLTLRCLDRDEVRNPSCRIGPEIGRDLFRGAEGGIDIVGDGLRVETELQRPRPIDVHHEGRRIEFLLKMSVGDARNARNAAAQLLRHA